MEKNVISQSQSVNQQLYLTIQYTEVKGNVFINTFTVDLSIYHVQNQKHENHNKQAINKPKK